MNRLIIPIQSVNDLITNSSSEIIIMRGNNKDKEEVLEIMGALWTAAKLDNHDYYGYRAFIADYDYCNSDYEYKFKKGDLVVESQGDNSIPYWFMEYLECHTPLEVDRKHLG